MKSRLYTTAEVAEELGLSYRTLEVWRVQGGGPRYVRMGRGLRSPVRYRREDIDAWVERQVRDNTSQEAV